VLAGIEALTVVVDNDAASWNRSRPGTAGFLVLSQALLGPDRDGARDSSK
jgi:hypothetical protein